MSKSDEILALVQRQPGLTDQQIRVGLGMKNVVHVNAICHKLEAQGKIRREKGPNGLIINVPFGAPRVGKHGGYSVTVQSPTAPSTSPAAEITKLWEHLAGLDLAHTLLVIPCSAKKAGGGDSQTGPQLASSLPPTLAHRLAAAQATVASKIKMDTTALLPAWQRYQGALYRAAQSALKAAMVQRSHLLILSGGCGVVLAKQPIGFYNQELKPGCWPNQVLQHCLAAYAEKHGLTGMVGFAGKCTNYAKIIRSTSWPSGVKHAFLVSPTPPANGGAMTKDPQALGEAFAAFWAGKLDVGWTSSKHLLIAIETLV